MKKRVRQTEQKNGRVFVEEWKGRENKNWREKGRAGEIKTDKSGGWRGCKEKVKYILKRNNHRKDPKYICNRKPKKTNKKTDTNNEGKEKK